MSVLKTVHAFALAAAALWACGASAQQPFALEEASIEGIHAAIKSGQTTCAQVVEGYIARVEPLFEKSGFYEKEIARRVESFGSIAHVWSTYESRHDPSDPEPFMRGINSIQLFNDGKRWWVLSILWQHESTQQPLPKQYV